MKRRVANGTAWAGLRLAKLKRFRHSRGPGVHQHRIRSRVKILLPPGQILTPLFTGAAMTTRRLTPSRAQKFAAVLRANNYLPDRCFRGRDSNEKNGPDQQAAPGRENSSMNQHGPLCLHGPPKEVDHAKHE